MALDSCRREALEDLLEEVWLCRESERAFDPSRCRTRVPGPPPAEIVVELVAKGLLVAEGEAVRLTEAGAAAAARVVRRHRLAERLYTDLLQAREDGRQSFACGFEHILSDEVTEAVCTLLGHPPTCPHGHEIPPGECCRRAQREVAPLVRPLSEFAPGDKVRIAFLAPRFHQRLDRLHSFGVLPGAVLHLHQKQPAFVLRIGATEVALEKEVAHEIYGIRVE